MLDYRKLYKKYKLKYKNLLAGSNLTRSKSDSNLNSKKKPRYVRSESAPSLINQSDSDLEDDELYLEAKDQDWNTNIDSNHPVDPYINKPRDIPSEIDDSNYLAIDSSSNTYDPLYGSQKIGDISRPF